MTITLTPVYDPAGAKRTRLGFAYAPRAARDAAGSARPSTSRPTAFWFITKSTLELPARLINPEQRKEITGVVGLLRGHAPDDPRPTSRDVIGILAIISLSLAIVNLFPFLPLDGGHIFWAIVEKVRRKPVPLRVMERAGVVGFMLVILIFLIGLSNDIGRLSGRGLPDVR